MKVLLLGGTAEARELASLLVSRRVDVTSSLAGRVARPRLPVGEVRIGGFGGVDGLRSFLRGGRVRLVVDATHPFAEGISANAVRASTAEGIALLRLQRPGWHGSAGSDGWHWVDGHPAAARTAADLGSRPFLTVGRQALGESVPSLGDRDVLVRVVDESGIALPTRWSVVLSRGPYKLQGEIDLMRGHRADALVTNDSGGDHSRAKLEAAAMLGVPVVVVRRAEPPIGVEVVSDPAAAAAWVAARLTATATRTSAVRETPYSTTSLPHREPSTFGEKDLDDASQIVRGRSQPTCGEPPRCPRAGTTPGTTRCMWTAQECMPVGSRHASCSPRIRHGQASYGNALHRPAPRGRILATMTATAGRRTATGPSCGA